MSRHLNKDSRTRTLVYIRQAAVNFSFSPTCCFCTRSDWTRLTIDGASVVDALRCWEAGGRNEKNHYQRQLTSHHHRHHHRRHHQPTADRPRVDDSLPRLLTGYNPPPHFFFPSLYLFLLTPLLHNRLFPFLLLFRGHFGGGDALERRSCRSKAAGTHGNDVPIVKAFKNASRTAVRTISGQKCTGLQDFAYIISIFCSR